MGKLEKAAAKAVQLARPRADERVLVVTDAHTVSIGEALLSAAGDNAQMLIIKEGARASEEPPKEVAEIMLKGDVLFCPTKYSLTHTNAVRAVANKGGRVATLPGITEDLFITGMAADPKKIAARGEKIKKKLQKAKTVHIEAEGTQLNIVCQGRKIKNDTADLTKPGAVHNLPWGEVCFAPVRGMTNGVFVVKNSPFCEKDTRFVVRDGFVDDIIGDDAFRRKVFNLTNARNIAEFAMGTNDKLKLTGNTLGDEKVFGTCHVALGDSKSLGGEVTADVHWDFVIKKPTIYFDLECVMKNGRLKIK